VQPAVQKKTIHQQNGCGAPDLFLYVVHKVNTVLLLHAVELTQSVVIREHVAKVQPPQIVASRGKRAVPVHVVTQHRCVVLPAIPNRIVAMTKIVAAMEIVATLQLRIVVIIQMEETCAVRTPMPVAEIAVVKQDSIVALI